jgi:hypothetical protein
LQRVFGQEPQSVLTNRLIEGTDFGTVPNVPLVLRYHCRGRIKGAY